MPRIRSLLIRAEVDEARKAHNCQGNTRHRIERGDKRLNVRNGRSWDRYCLACAGTITRRDIDRLQALLRELDGVRRAEAAAESSGESG